MNNPQGPYPPNRPEQHGRPPQQRQPYQPHPQQHQQRPPGPGNYSRPQYPPQQQFGAPPPRPQEYRQPAQGAEGIAVTTEFFPLSFILLLFKPKIAVDGHETQAPDWGRTVVPARPGQHRVHVHVPYLLPQRLGPADTVVDVYPGRLSELEYKAPVWAFSPGSLGNPPQSYNGVGITIGVLAAIVVVAIIFPMILVMLANI
jgi:hypothetical protein